LLRKWTPSIINKVPIQPNPGVIVVVEDPFVRGFLRNVLTKSGYQVVPAEVQRGLDLMRAGGANVDLLITNNPAVFAEVAERIPLLYLSGLPDPEQASGFRVSRILRKPFHPRQLLAAVAELAGS
jgi:DNA-binding response OmpR family regulator